MTKGNIDDFIVPKGRVLEWAGPTMPRMLERHVSQAAKGMAEAGEITHLFGGRGKKPDAPILIIGPDGRTPIIVMCDGDVEAAEAQDLAQEAIGRQAEQMAASGRGMDYDRLRERNGYMSRERVDQGIRDAIAQRIARHKANPVTDPFREPRKLLGHFPVTDHRSWTQDQRSDER